MRLRIAPVLFGFLLASCNSDEGTGPLTSLGSATVQVTGAVTRSFTATAAFGTGLFGAGVFGIVMPDDDGGIELGITRTGTRPPVGTFTLGNSEATAYGELIVDLAGGGSDFYISTTGSVTITESTATSLRGTITFQAQEEFGGTSTINVTATFNAICFPNAGISCN